MKNNLLSALKWGIIGALAVIIVETVFLMLGWGMKGGFGGSVVYLPLIFVMIFGGITIRKENGGNLPFGQAFLSVLIIGLIGSIVLNFYVYRIWAHFIDADFMNKIYAISDNSIREQADKRGMSDEDVDRQMAFVRKLPFELIGYGMNILCSLIFSLIISAFVSRTDNRTIIKPAE
jgi:riboflavin transporter FmnP